MPVQPPGGPSAGEPLNPKRPDVTKIQNPLKQVLEVLNQPNICDDPQKLKAVATAVTRLHQVLEQVLEGTNADALGKALTAKCAEADQTMVTVTIVKGAKEFDVTNAKTSHLREVLSDQSNVTQVVESLKQLNQALQNPL